MSRKGIAIWLALIMLFSFVVIIVEITPTVRAPTIIYVDDEPGGFPPENYISIQEAINAANPGDTVFVYNGTYKENVNVNKVINLTGEDKNNTTVDGNATGYAIGVSSDWVNITGFTLTNGSLFSPLLFISGVDHCRICDSIVRDSEDIGISIEFSSNVDVLNNTLFGNGKYGINVGASDNILVDWNDIYDNNNDCIRTIGSSLVTISNNIVRSNSARGIVIGSNSDNCIVENNTIDNSMTGLHGVGIIDASNSTFMNNSMNKWGFYLDGWFIHNWNTHTIDNSNIVGGKPIYYQKNQVGGTVSGNPGQIILGNCTDITISDQTIDNSHPALYLGFSNYNNILNCVLDGGGIDLYRSNNNTFNFDTINNTGRAITLRYSDWNTITNCSILNSDEGAYLHYSCNNTLSNNTVDLHTQHGFKLISYSNENTICENTISNNPYGIRLYSDSKNNTIYWNNFVNNGIQAWDQGNNIWNLTYPLGGNYWSNYSGVDNYKGPKQNIPGSDGIGDINYTIDSDSVDNYPLMHPYKPLENYLILKQGWNLISIPMIQEEQNLTRVLGSIDGWYDRVWRYNNTDKNDQWKLKDINKPFGNDLLEINEKMGFWVNITQRGDTIFLYNGTQIFDNQTIKLYPGWNLVGYPSIVERTPPFDLPSCVDVVQWYNTSSARWENWDPGTYYNPDTLLKMRPGQGLWIHSTANTMWTLENPPSPTVDYILITDVPSGTELITVTLPIGGTVTAYASGYNKTGSTYVGLVDVDWSQMPVMGSFDNTVGTSTTFTVGYNGGTTTITGQNISMTPTVSDDFTVTILDPTVDFIVLTDSPNGNELVDIIMPVGGSISAYASGYNITGYIYIDLVECDWTDNGGIWSPNPAEGSAFAAGAIPGSFWQTATSTSDPSIFDTFLIELV